jgi:hypothetical protein
MSGFMNTLFKILVFVTPVALITGLLMIALRVKRGEAILALLPEQRTRSRVSHGKILSQIRHVLILYPALVLSFAAAYWVVPGLDGPMMLIAGVEFGLLLATQYWYERWLVRYLTENEERPSAFKE